MKKLFVYGTLMRGERNHSRLEGCRFVGEGKTGSHYELLDNGDFPAIRPGTNRIHGEIYAVPDAMWDMLDRFEGTPTFYSRIQDTVEGMDMFLYRGIGCFLRGNWETIASGNYKDRK